MVDKTNCLSVCYLHQLRLFIEYKIVALRGLSINFFKQVILKAPLLPNSNIQEDFVTPPQAVYTAGLMRKHFLVLISDNRVQNLLDALLNTYHSS